MTALSDKLDPTQTGLHGAGTGSVCWPMPQQRISVLQIRSNGWQTWNWMDGEAVPSNVDSAYRSFRRKHGIESFNFNHHKSRQQMKSKILHLLDLDFINQGTNIILIGNPGTGKTFLSKIIGWKACQANLRVLFTLPCICSINWSHLRPIIRWFAS